MGSGSGRSALPKTAFEALTERTERSQPNAASLRCRRRFGKRRSLVDLGKRAPQIREHVPRQDGLLGLGLLENRDLGSAATAPRGDASGVVERHTLANQAGTNTSQYIAHSARRHAGIAG